MNQTCIGIIGGMGPEASAQFYINLTKKTAATCDAEHYHVIIDSNAKIPDRTAFILGEGPSPVPALIQSAQRLEDAGAQVACIPCITAHNFYEQIQSAVSLRLINAIDQVNRHIQQMYPNVKKVGVLCTTGTKKMAIYDRHLTDLQLLYPNAQDQTQLVMPAIYGADGIKAGNIGQTPTRLLQRAAKHLIAEGAEIIIAGCTEIPLALKAHHLALPYIDTMAVVIDELLKLE